MQKIELQNRKGQKIVGLLHIPEGDVKGTAIIQHGYGGSKEESHIQVLEKVLHEHGFVTFNFDTTNSFGESDGTYWEARLGLHAEDLEDVVKWTEQQEWFVRPLVLTGHSMGGYAVARYAEEYPEEVDILIPVAPVVSGKLSWETHQENDTEGFAAFKKRGYREIVSQRTGLIRKSPWAEMEERLNHDLLPLAKNLTMPTLLVVGTEDESCQPQDIKLLYDALPPNAKNQYSEIEGAPHTYRTEEHLQALYDRVNNWLKTL
jgi:pimeloyl-ACP methyl ester carboxylesterase